MDHLKYLIGAHFHQDWNHVYPSRQASVDDFLHRSPVVAAKVPGEIDLLLDTVADDGELRRRLDELGFDDAPAEAERAFLVAVRDQIRAGLGHGPNE